MPRARGQRANKRPVSAGPRSPGSQTLPFSVLWAPLPHTLTLQPSNTGAGSSCFQWPDTVPCPWGSGKTPGGPASPLPSLPLSERNLEGLQPSSESRASVPGCRKPGGGGAGAELASLLSPALYHTPKCLHQNRVFNPHYPPTPAPQSPMGTACPRAVLVLAGCRGLKRFDSQQGPRQLLDFEFNSWQSWWAGKEM